MNNRHLSSKQIFVFASIIVIAVFISRFFNITLSIISFLTIALMICLYLYKSKLFFENTNKKEISIDADNKKIVGKLNKYLNSLEYSNIVNNLKNFVEIYKYVQNNNKNIYQNIQFAETELQSINTGLSTIIYKTTSYIKIIRLKYLSQKIIKILNNYLNIMIEQCNDLYKSSTNIESYYYDKDIVKPSNYFDTVNTYIETKYLSTN